MGFLEVSTGPRRSLVVTGCLLGFLEVSGGQRRSPVVTRGLLGFLEVSGGHWRSHGISGRQELKGGLCRSVLKPKKGRGQTKQVC